MFCGGELRRIGPGTAARRRLRGIFVRYRMVARRRQKVQVKQGRSTGILPLRQAQGQNDGSFVWNLSM
jgi:hypothetical protein